MNPQRRRGNSAGTRLFDQRMKRAHDRQLEHREGGVLDVEVVVDDRAVGRMDADRQVELLRRLVEREEIGMRQRQIAFQTAHEHAARAVLPAERELRADPVHRLQGGHDDPAEPPAPLRPDVGQPAVVGPDQGRLAAERARDGAQEQGRVEDLDVDPERVHVAQPSRDVGHFARLFRRVETDVAVLAMDHAVDHPELAHRIAGIVPGLVAEGLRDDPGQVLPLGLAQIGEGRGGLDHMGVGIDRRHRHASARTSSSRRTARRRGRRGRSCPPPSAFRSASDRSAGRPPSRRAGSSTGGR